MYSLNRRKFVDLIKPDTQQLLAGGVPDMSISENSRFKKTMVGEILSVRDE